MKSNCSLLGLPVAESLEKEIVEGLDKLGIDLFAMVLFLIPAWLKKKKKDNSLNNVAPCICNLILRRAVFPEVCTLEKKLLLLVRAVAVLDPECVRGGTGF